MSDAREFDIFVAPRECPTRFGEAPALHRAVRRARDHERGHGDRALAGLRIQTAWLEQRPIVGERAIDRARYVQRRLDVIERRRRRHIAGRGPLTIDRLDVREIVTPDKPLRPGRLVVDEMRRVEEERRIAGE